ncbi:MAG: hypothetical protein R2873_05135 [Caldilineaceae bacterium]
MERLLHQDGDAVGQRRCQCDPRCALPFAGDQLRGDGGSTLDPYIEAAGYDLNDYW